MQFCTYLVDTYILVPIFTEKHYFNGYIFLGNLWIYILYYFRNIYI